MFGSFMNFLFLTSKLLLWGHPNCWLAPSVTLELLLPSQKKPDHSEHSLRQGSGFPVPHSLPLPQVLWPLIPVSYLHKCLYSFILHFSNEEMKSQERWDECFRNVQLVIAAPGCKLTPLHVEACDCGQWADLLLSSTLFSWVLSFLTLWYLFPVFIEKVPALGFKTRV